MRTRGGERRRPEEPEGSVSAWPAGGLGTRSALQPGRGRLTLRVASSHVAAFISGSPTTCRWLRAVSSTALRPQSPPRPMEVMTRPPRQAARESEACGSPGGLSRMLGAPAAFPRPLFGGCAPNLAEEGGGVARPPALTPRVTGSWAGRPLAAGLRPCCLGVKVHSDCGEDVECPGVPCGDRRHRVWKSRLASRGMGQPRRPCHRWWPLGTVASATRVSAGVGRPHRSAEGPTPTSRRRRSEGRVRLTLGGEILGQEHRQVYYLTWRNNKDTIN